MKNLCYKRIFTRKLFFAEKLSFSIIAEVYIVNLLLRLKNQIFMHIYIIEFGSILFMRNVLYIVFITASLLCT